MTMLATSTAYIVRDRLVGLYFILLHVFRVDLFRLYIFFPNTNHVMILERFDPLSCSVKGVHASMNMSACTIFNEQVKGSNLPSIMTHDSCAGKTKCTSEKGENQA